MDPKYAHKTGAARFRALLTCLLLALPILAYAHIAPGDPDHDPGYHADLANGVVFHDRDGDGKIGPREEGIEGVRVSNGREIVLTDQHGRWELPYDDDTIFFITKPRGWTTPFNEYNIPQFHYIHRPEGSPDLRFGGIEPTGPLPDSIDFPLYPSEEPEQFQALFFGDTQPRDEREVEYIRRDVIAELIGAKQYSFGVTLGDIVFDDLRIFQPLKEAIALVGIPWYYVLGNHDINFDAQSDADSDDTYNRHFGPSYYSFDYGPTHFMVLDDVMWHPAEGDQRGRYTGGLGPKQMEWIKNDLRHTPKDQLVVLMMHIPLTGVGDRQELYRLIEQRPYAMSVSAHTHWQRHVYITEEDGWRKPEPHHHVINVTVCGSWWEGEPDELGIPHTTMRDGAPNGYSIFSFDGNQYSIEFKAARRPADYQMRIMVPFEVASSEASDTPVYVNVFGGSKYSKVEMRFGDSELWIPLEHIPDEQDPEYVKMWEEDQDLEAPYRPLPNPQRADHLWKGSLPLDPEPGTYPIHIRTEDQFGQVYYGQRSVRISD